MKFNGTKLKKKVKINDLLNDDDVFYSFNDIFVID